MVHVVLLQVDPAQNSENLAELQVKASRSDPLSHVQASHRLPVYVALQTYRLLLQLLLELQPTYLKPIYTDGEFDNLVEGRLEVGPANYAVEDVRSDIATVFLLQFYQLWLRFLFLLCSLFQMFLLVLRALLILGVPGRNSRALEFLGIHGVAGTKAEAVMLGGEKLLLLDMGFIRAEGGRGILGIARKIAIIAILPRVEIPCVKTIEVKHIILLRFSIIAT